MTKITPMMQQYLEIKAQHPEALLLYRMGDFYELFMDDAVTAARILEITLTSRDRHAENPVPMCGVPYHSADGYITRLVASGQKVAICDQIEDPRHAKGLVRRAVTRVITPGLIVDSGNLNAKQSNYLAAVNQRGSHCGLAYLDVSTGEFRAVELEGPDALSEELLRVAPREVLLSAAEDLPLLSRQPIGREFTITRIDLVDFDRTRAAERLCQHFQVTSLDGFGIQANNPAVGAAGAILA